MTSNRSANQPSGWQAIIGLSLIMSLALIGDALLYAVLPVYAESFGLSLPWVGVMLSVNRLVRVFAYAQLTRVTGLVGVRRMCILAAIMATLSTAMYGFGQGPFVILTARIVWGLTYAVLVLATLSYSVAFRERVGTKVGVAQAIQRLGPILALLGGGWLVGVLGPNSTFALLAIPTALSILIAYSFLQGYGVDGVFALSITLILARQGSLSEAVIGGSALLAVRHFGEAIAAPLFGFIADKAGTLKVFTIAAVLTTCGFIMVAFGFTVSGAIIMLIFRGALASLGPAVIVNNLEQDQDVISPLARMHAWRDLGAAIGPLTTGFLLTAVSAEFLHGAVAILLSFTLLYWAKLFR